MCLTDLVSVSAAVIAEEQHSAVGKETGETAQVERWNTTLRKPLARFARMTLSFSRSAVMHEVCLLLFLYRYNLLMVRSFLKEFERIDPMKCMF